MTVFAKGANQQSLKLLAEETLFDTFGLDWCIDPAVARGIVGTKALQGNLDPGVLYGGREAIEREVKRMCASFRQGGGAPKAWIANLGHGITPGVDPEDMKFFLECVHKYSSASTAL